MWSLVEGRDAKGAGAILFGSIIAHCLRGDKTRGVIDETIDKRARRLLL
jgi:hypothetical protein